MRQHFQDFIPSCRDPTYCEVDPPRGPASIIQPESWPEPGTWRFLDGNELEFKCPESCEHDIFHSIFGDDLDYFQIDMKFPDPEEDIGDWSSSFYVACGWNKQWEPNVIPECVDTRQCSKPPPGTQSVISGTSFLKLFICSYFHKRNVCLMSLEYDSFPNRRSQGIGATFWYQCSFGNFRMRNGTITSIFFLTCVGDSYGNAPEWQPYYMFYPFPECQILRKYSNKKNLVM